LILQVAGLRGFRRVQAAGKTPPSDKENVSEGGDWKV